MDERVIPISCFAAGAFLQAILLPRGRKSPLKFAACVALGLIVGAIPSKDEVVYQAYNHALIVIGVFALAFAMFFAKDVLQPITERSVLFYTLILWFAFFVFGPEPISDHYVLLAGISAPTIVTAYWVFRDTENGFWTRLFLYTWFLCAIVGIGLLQFPFADLGMFSEEEGLPPAAPLDSFAFGMAFMFLAVNVIYLYLLIPLPSRSQSWRERLEERHELTEIMTERLLAEDLIWRWTAVFFLGLISVLALDLRDRWIAPGLLINLLLVAPGIVLTRLTAAQVADAGHGARRRQ